MAAAKTKRPESVPNKNISPDNNSESEESSSEDDSDGEPKPKKKRVVKRKEVGNLPRTAVYPPRKQLSKNLPYAEVEPLREVRPPGPPKIGNKGQAPLPEKGKIPNKRVSEAEQEMDVAAVVKKAAWTPSVSLTMGELVAISPLIGEEMRRHTARHRRPVDPITKQTIEKLINAPINTLAVQVQDIPMDSYDFEESEDQQIPERTIVGWDPVLQYLNTLEGEERREIYASQDSYAIRSIFPKINGVGQEEAILDSGSQIVSMAEEVARELGLTWDPNVTINMQSANRTVDKTLGLARNVRFSLGGIDVYLQVHIIKKPAYRVLLGRPFEVVTRSTTKNEEDGSQTLILTDPNDKTRKVVLPTYQRGENPETLQRQKQQAF